MLINKIDTTVTGLNRLPLLAGKKINIKYFNYNKLGYYAWEYCNSKKEGWKPVLEYKNLRTIAVNNKYV